ncbi:MAG: hypothetical protein ACLT8E_07425 [Akkermansia sp.]
MVVALLITLFLAGVFTPESAGKGGTDAFLGSGMPWSPVSFHIAAWTMPKCLSSLASTYEQRGVVFFGGRSLFYEVRGRLHEELSCRGTIFPERRASDAARMLKTFLPQQRILSFFKATA